MPKQIESQSRPTKPADKEEFYEDMDQQTRRSSAGCCSCSSCGLIILIIILLLGFAGWFIYSRISVKVEPTTKVYISQQSAETFKQKIDKAKISTTDEEQSAAIVNSEEFSSFLLSGDEKPFPLKNAQAVILPAKIELYGTLTFPAKTNVIVNLIPYVSEGKIIVKTQNILAGNLVLPQLISKRISSSIEKRIEEKLAKIDLNISEIMLGDGKMTILGSSKE